MRNLKLEIVYDGTNYCGWQVQNCRRSQVAGRRSIQETIEKTLRKILQEKVHLIASGRTDAGVHALGQVANFKTSSHLGLESIQKALNCLLPLDISISSVSEVELDFHARYSAKSKIYRYCISNRIFPSVFLRRFSFHVPYSLNLTRMRQEAKVLLGCHDFKSFCASNTGIKGTVRTIKKISIQKILSGLFVPYPIKPPVSTVVAGHAESHKLVIVEIEADGFLYNMVRNIVGTLVEIGRAKFKPGDLKAILLAKDRRRAGPTAPAKGLFLVKVRY